VDRLAALYGEPEPPLATDPFERVLWENVGYLVDDERRRAVFERLRAEVGLTPEAILACPEARLAAVTAEGGMLPEHRAGKLQAAAAILLEVGAERLRELLRTKPQEARKLLKRFPGIADPGADLLLLLAGAVPSLAPDSNALRVLVRLGFSAADGDYSRQYRTAARALAPQLPNDFAWLIRARELLRTHGQRLCRRTEPRCEPCPLSAGCRWYRDARGRVAS